jgi:hypothetical protein
MSERAGDAGAGADYRWLDGGPATAFLAYCPGSNGIIPPGDCVMSNGVTGLWAETGVPGPATYTLMVLQQQSNGSMKVLDSKTVDVVLTRTIEF